MQLNVTDDFYASLYRPLIDGTEWQFRAGDDVFISTPVYLRGTTIYAVDHLKPLEFTLKKKHNDRIGWYKGDLAISLFDHVYYYKNLTIKVDFNGQEILSVI